MSRKLHLESAVKLKLSYLGGALHKPSFTTLKDNNANFVRISKNPSLAVADSKQEPTGYLKYII